MNDLDPTGSLEAVPLDSPASQQVYRHVSVVDGVAATLRNWIFEGRLAIGEQLKEVQLAQKLGVGRYSLRSAIEVLNREGLVRHERNRGAFVRKMTPEDIDDLFVLREAIEGQTAALVVERRLDLAPLRQVLEQFLKLGPDAKPIEVNRFDFQFHRVLNEMVGSERLRQAFDAIQPQLRMLLSIPRDDIPDKTEVAEYHARLFTALESGDPEHARRAMREHINVLRVEAVHFLGGADSKGAARPASV